jgi:hypothetical protein
MGAHFDAELAQGDGIDALARLSSFLVALGVQEGEAAIGQHVDEDAHVQQSLQIWRVGRRGIDLEKLLQLLLPRRRPL